MAEIISISSFFPLPGTTDTELLHLQRSEGAKGFGPTAEIGAEVAHVGFPGASLSFHHPSRVVPPPLGPRVYDKAAVTRWRFQQPSPSIAGWSRFADSVGHFV